MHLAAARAQAAQYLTGRGMFTRTSGGGSFNPATGTITPAAEITVFEGPIGVGDRRRRDETWGAQTLSAGEVMIRAAIEANTVLPGDKLTITDPGDFPVERRTLWVDRVEGRTMAVLARIVCTSVEPGADGRG